MNVLTKPRMNVDDFLAWAEGRPARYEWYRGEVSEASSETAGHVETKAAVYVGLLNSARAGGVACHVFADGMTVRVDETTAFEPDALVYCGDKVPRSSVEVPHPVVVVEVLSQSTRQVDTTVKLAGYFKVPSVAHYLIIDPNEPMVVHHSRRQGSDILTRVVAEGSIKLDPPGLELTVADIYGG